MKYSLLLIFSLFTATCINTQNLYLNTKTPYQPQQIKHTSPPKNYTPVFINYVGRHGARFLTSKGNDVLVADVLQQAQQQHALTPIGEMILKQVQQLVNISTNNYGNITLLGEEEQHAIAARMQKEYAPVFSKGKLMIEMTSKVRTQQSATAFLSGLSGYDSTHIQSYIFPADADSILRFYDLSAAYKTYEESTDVKQHIDSLKNDKQTLLMANNVCSKIFTNAFINQLNKGEIKSSNITKTQAVTTTNFSFALYEVYCMLFSVTKEMQLTDKTFSNNYKAAFTDNDLAWFDKITSVEDFYEKGPAENANGIQVTIASPLLRNMLNTTDSMIEHKTYDGIFRFTHAEAISPLATLMEIPQASKTSNSVFDFSRNWNAAYIIPLSANIQWILYSNGSNYLIKVLLNEKEVALPVKTNSFPYYNWNDVKEYYSKKLSGVDSK